MTWPEMPPHEEVAHQHRRSAIGSRPPRKWLNRFAIAVFVAGLLASLLVMGNVGYLILTDQFDPHGTRESSSRGNLHQIGIALHNYTEVYGTFPPAAIDDASGRPQVSWRTLLLPFVEERPLYEKYRFDRPWNDPSNALARTTSLAVYHSNLNRYDSGHLTSYVVVTSRRRMRASEQTAFPGNKPVSFSDVKDDKFSTIVVVEIRNTNIEWSEPRDIDIDTLTTDLDAPNAIDLDNGVLVAFANASTRRLPPGMTLAEFKTLLTIAGGEAPPEFSLEDRRARRKEARF